MLKKKGRAKMLCARPFFLVENVFDAMRQAVLALAQFRQHLLGDRFERVEDADAFVGDRLVDGFILAAQFADEFFGGDNVRQIAFVELENVGEFR